MWILGCKGLIVLQKQYMMLNRLKGWKFLKRSILNENSLTDSSDENNLWSYSHNYFSM